MLQQIKTWIKKKLCILHDQTIIYKTIDGQEYAILVCKDCGKELQRFKKQK